MPNRALSIMKASGLQSEELGLRPACAGKGHNTVKQKRFHNRLFKLCYLLYTRLQTIGHGRYLILQN